MLNSEAEADSRHMAQIEAAAAAATVAPDAASAATPPTTANDEDEDDKNASAAADLSALEKELIAELRGPRGVRLRNCELNVGKAKYAFNDLQQMALPTELRPPPHTASGGKS